MGILNRDDYYFILFGQGVRIWFKPKYWQLGRYKTEDRVVYELGPITIYTGW